MGAIEHLIAGVKRGLGLHHPGRRLRILPDHVFLVSYPQSENTWMRFLLADLLHPEQCVACLRYELIMAGNANAGEPAFRSRQWTVSAMITCQEGSTVD
jgi:hypothetical protein